MSITLRSEDDSYYVTVPRQQLASSQYINDLLSQYGLDNNSNLEVKLPTAYLDIIAIYLAVSEGDHLLRLPTINNIDILLAYFEMEAYFADDNFFNYCLSQAYSHWVEFQLCISALPDERLFYLHTPYEFVPPKYINNSSFFKQWLAINSNKQIVITVSGANNNSGDRIYYTTVTFYNEAESRPHKLACYYLADGIREGKVHEESWYPNTELEYRENYKKQPWSLTSLLTSYFFKSNSKQQSQHQQLHKHHGQYHVFSHDKDYYVDGLQEFWYPSGQLQFRKTYKDGKQVGVSEAWYEMSAAEMSAAEVAANVKPVLKHRYHYTNDMWDGSWEEWYPNGQLHVRQIYKMNMRVVKDWWREDGMAGLRAFFENGMPSGTEMIVTDR